MTGVYDMTMRTHNGKELHSLVWLTTAYVCKDFFNRADKNGIEIVVNKKISD